MDIKEVLEKIALPARSNKHGFKDTTKLEAIESLLSENGSPFHIIHKTDHTWMFGRADVEPGKSIVMVSSHADIVDGIKNPFSELDEETHYFKGTYDNLGTNAAAVYLMLEKDIPDNVVFAFNDEEETGKCLGARDALSYVRSTSEREPIVFALDVTDEGYDNDRLFTVEGFHAGNDGIRRYFLQKMLDTEGEKQSFEVVKLKKKDDVSVLPKEYLSDELTVFDESVFYAENGCLSCSICLPGDGSMHTDSGFYVKEPVMRGYAESLAQIVFEFSGHSLEANAYKEIKDSYVSQAKEVPFRKTSYTYYSSCGGYHSGVPYTLGDYMSGAHRDKYSELTDEQYEEMVAYNSSFGIYGDSDEWASFVDQVMSESWEIAEGYNKDEFEVFYQDMVAMYGLEDCVEAKSTLARVFVDVNYPCYDDDGEWDEDMAEEYENALEDLLVDIYSEYDKEPDGDMDME